MIRKTKEKLKARELRGRGRSIKDIGKILGVSSSTVSLWVRDIVLTESQKQKLINKVFSTLQKGRVKAQKVQRKMRLRHRARIEKEALRQLGKISPRDLFVAGIALYWGEGFKKDNRLGFASLDPAMIKIFLEWLKVNGVSREDIRVRVGLNISHKKRIKIVEKYWSKETGVPLSQFQKPFFQNFKWKKEFASPESYFGVLRIRAINQGPLFIKIKKWIEVLRGGS